MKGACEEGGSYLKNIKTPTSAKLKNLQERSKITKQSTASTAKWLFLSTIKDGVSNHLLYHLALELGFGVLFIDFPTLFHPGIL